jgi:hypothetical protein
MVTATAWTPSEYESYTFPHTTWTAEIRFPIRQTPGYGTEGAEGAEGAEGGGYPTSHGGLLDADPVRQKEWNQYDPALGDAGPGRPRYWWVNFARAEHPRNYTMSDHSSIVCPLNCTVKLESAVRVGEVLDYNSLDGWPTILGVPPYGGYWEWVWGAVGDAHPGEGEKKRRRGEKKRRAEKNLPYECRVCAVCGVRYAVCDILCAFMCGVLL